MDLPPQTVWRIVRRGVLAISALLGAYMVVRFGFETIPPGYSLLEPRISPGCTALVDRRYRWSRPLAKDDLVSFRLQTKAGAVKRYGRVTGVPGSRLEADEEGLRVDGALTGYPAPAERSLPAEVPGEHVLVAFNAAERARSDDRPVVETALVAEDAVLARLLLAVSGRE